MSRFFSTENPVMSYFALLRDWIILSVLWSIFSLPLITVGASTAAVYYVTLKMVRGEGVPVAKTFFRAFRENLKQGVCVTLFFAVCLCVLGFAYAYTSVARNDLGTVLVLCVLSFLAATLSVALYSFPFMAQFSNTVGGILKSAAYLAGKNLTNTIVMILLNTIPAWVFLLSQEVFWRMLPIWMFMMPGTVAYLCSMRLIKIFDPLIAAIKSRETTSEQEIET